MPTVKVVADTNILLRVILREDAQQIRSALAVAAQADLVPVSLRALCELVCVLRRIYKVSRVNIAATVRCLANTQTMVLNQPAVDARLSLHDAGVDFANGVTAFKGRWLGGETFVSFDQEAVALLTAQSKSARLL